MSGELWEPVRYVAALGPVAIAGAVAWVAFWQFRVAKEKLRHDLFDRRMSVYLAFSKAITEFLSIKPGDFRIAGSKISPSPQNEKTLQIIEKLASEMEKSLALSVFLFSDELHQKMKTLFKTTYIEANTIDLTKTFQHHKDAIEYQKFIESTFATIQTNLRKKEFRFDGFSELFAPYLKLRDFTAAP